MAVPYDNPQRPLAANPPSATLNQRVVTATLVAVPRSSGDHAPVSYLTSGTWPDGRLRTDAPLSAIYGQEFTKRLRTVIDQRGLNPLAIQKATGVSRRTIERALKGEVLPDFGALARLESGLDVDLWPDRASMDQRSDTARS